MLPTTNNGYSVETVKTNPKSTRCMMVKTAKLVGCLMLLCGMLSGTAVTFLYLMEHFIDTEGELLYVGRIFRGAIVGEVFRRGVPVI